ncbi:peroxisomal biogenesis factor 6 isoform X2 [Lycorma delicatula]|uniref:peroxisomal biogenesis factor 6 isoform X2 n=1 Tax=Lycorma delicatula TaxID=130591 RepID=UPI003F50D83A
MALSQDREGNEDVRIVNYFNKLLMELSCDLPVIIVGTTTSVDQLSFELQQNILHIINIDNPSLDERADAISWLCNLSHSTALKVAARTSGFILSDLTFLVSQTYSEKYKLMDENEKENVNNGIEFEDFVLVIDKMNSQFAGAIGAPQVPTVNWTDIGGHNEIKKEIVRSLNTADFGTGLRRSGILLWGPPGTGKTLLAKAVATECGSTFLSVKGPELLNMYVGQSEQNVRQVFERAREAAPCIIFFDELDSLAPNRGKSDSTGVMDRVVSQLLSEMDGLQKNEGVFVLGATNRPDLIDPALLRPGRLDKMLYVGPCEGTDAKLNVLKALTRKFKMNEVDLYKIADSLPRCLTGADLYSVCYNAWQNAARNVIRQMENSTPDSSRAVIVSADDFVAAVDNLALNS